MKKNSIYFLMLISFSIAFTACEEDNEILLPFPQDITFEEFDLGRFAYNIPDGPFQAGDEKSGVVTVNVVRHSSNTFSGFALTNKSFRSYPWNLSPDFSPGSLTPTQIQHSVDSTIFSAYTPTPNRMGNYLIGRAKDNDAFITLSTPSVVEHVLVANTTYNWLLATYGSNYSRTLDAATQHYSLEGTPVRNPNNPNTSTAMFGRWHLPGPNGVDLVRLAGFEILQRAATGNPSLAKGYIKLTVTGFQGTANKGDVEFYLASRPNTDPEFPERNYIANNWLKVNLESLGEVDKLVFNITSDYVDESGNMMTPPYFCLDGIRIRK